MVDLSRPPRPGTRTMVSEGITSPVAARSRVPIAVGVVVLALGAVALAGAVLAFVWSERPASKSEPSSAKTPKSTPRDTPTAAQPRPVTPATLPQGASPCSRDLQAMSDALERNFGRDTRYLQIHVQPTMAVVMVRRATEPKLLGVYNFDFGTQGVTRISGSELTGKERFFDLGSVSWLVVGRLCSDASTRYKRVAGAEGEAMSLMVTSAAGQDPAQVTITVASPALSKPFCWDIRGREIDC